MSGLHLHAEGSANGRPAKFRSDPTAAILKSFNTWAFKREQPSDEGLMHRIVASAVAASGPVPFVLYWGKGPRRAVDTPDLQCLDYLAALAGRIRDAYRHGASITLLLTDSHARHNCHPEADIATYFTDIETAATERGFNCRRLSEVANTWPQSSLASMLQPRPDLLDRLTESAEKWYRGDQSSRNGAIEYFRLNMHEKAAVQAEYPGSIFVTFNNSKHRELFPAQLPIFYMYSIKKGVAVKPWFLDGAPNSGQVQPADARLRTTPSMISASERV